MIKKIAMTCGLVATLAACSSDPTAVTSTVDSRPSLVVMNAPYGASFNVDGIKMGRIDVDKAVLVEPGTHIVTVYSRNGKRLHKEKVYVSGSVLKRIYLPGAKVR